MLLYPTRGLSELKLENKYHAYYATKMALWCYLLPNWNINNLKVNPNLTGAELQRAQAILAAAKDIYVRGTAWNKIYSPRVTAAPDRDTAYAVTVDGQQYKQQVFTVHSDTWVCNYAIRVAFSDPASVPAGARIVDMNNKDITTITTSGTGDGYGGKFKVLYPAAAVAGKTGSVQLSFTTEVYKYAVFYAVCAEKNKYGQLQNYMCDTDPTTTMKLSTYSNYSDGGEVEPPDTGLKITKLEKGTDTPLSGAIFEVVGPDGATVGTFATGSDGTVTIPLTLAGNYTVYERVAPLDHLLSDKIEPQEKSIIDRSVGNIYREYIKNFQGQPPTLKDLYDDLMKQVNPEAHRIALALELFTVGSLNVFSHQTNINTKSRILCFDIQDLGENLKSVGLLVMLDAIYNRVIQNRKAGKYTHVYIDEIYLFFANGSGSGHSITNYSSEFLYKCWKRFRKYGATLTGITQNVEECLLSNTARMMFANSEFLLMLNQATTDREQLARLLGASDTQMSYVDNAPAGHGLIKVGGAIVPFANERPKNTELYRLMSTRPGEE